jgi:hypothetical protein
MIRERNVMLEGSSGVGMYNLGSSTPGEASERPV